MDQTGLTFVQVDRSAPGTSRRRTPPQLAESSRRLRALGAGKELNGALRTDLASIREVLEPLFWMEQMNAGYGDVFFAPPGAPFAGTLCQYGNLHGHMSEACTRGSIHFWTKYPCLSNCVCLCSIQTWGIPRVPAVQSPPSTRRFT